MFTLACRGTPGLENSWFALCLLLRPQWGWEVGGVHLQGTVKGAEVSEPPGHPCLCTCFLMGLVWGCQCLEHPSRGAFPALQSSVALKTSLGNGLDEIGEGQTPSGLQRAPSRGEADGTPVRTSGQGSLLDRPEGMAAWGYQGLEG